MSGLANANAAQLPYADGVFHCVVSSPPYWGLRAYTDNAPQVWGGDAVCKHKWSSFTRRGKSGGKNSPKQQTKGAANYGEFPDADQSLCTRCGAWLGCYGLEPTIDLYVANTVMIFREVWRVMRPDAVLWLNLGDCYAGNVNGRSAADGKLAGNDDRTFRDKPFSTVGNGLKPKDLCGVPWRVALALQADGWWLRRDVIWSKPNPMPESIGDRPATSHEYIFMLTKAERYYFDMDAVKEPSVTGDMRRPYGSEGAWQMDGRPIEQRHGGELRNRPPDGSRNLRSVWTIPTQPFNGAIDDWRSYDHVGQDGKPYKASLDCPVHGHLAHAQMSGTPEYGEQSEGQLSRNPGNGSHPVSSPVFAPDATTRRNHLDASGESALPQTIENTGESKTLAGHLAPTSDAKTQRRTNRISNGGEPLPDSLDSLAPSYSEPARSHSKRSRKTGRAHPTSEYDSASAQTASHTRSNLQSGGQTGSAVRTSESNNAAGVEASEMELDPLEQTLYRTEGNGKSSLLNCTCKPSKTQVDHFATFPNALAERCILASSSAYGVCSVCGAPWERIKNTTRTFESGSGKSGKMPNGKNGRDLQGGGETKDIRRGPVTRVTTTGWLPTCTHSAPTVPARVFDPFIGSGTTVAAARRLGRHGYGTDLSLTYLRDNALPRAMGRNTADSLATLPMFARPDGR